MFHPRLECISDGLKIFTSFSKVLKHMIHTSSGHTQQATSKGHRKRRTSIDTSSPYLLDSRVVASILNVSNKTTRTRTTTRERCLRDALPLPTTYPRFLAVPVHCKQLLRLLTSLSIEQTVFTPLTRGNRVRST